MARRISRQSVVFAAFVAFALNGHAQAPAAKKGSKPPTLSKTLRTALAKITAKDLQADVQFLASDELQGRSAPSVGLNRAADYIAEQFKKAGLSPVATDGTFFQTATLADFGNRGTQIERSLSVDAPRTMRNVLGLLRGSDPKLRDTYIIVSAHYDHLAPAASGDDKIFNGANDDASGTASVIELARALASMKPHPKRSILFMTFFGEERGLLGSRYYGSHPLVPPASTIAQINLEQVGRSDGGDGPHVNLANFTGFDFSDIPAIFADAAKPVGVEIRKDAMASDPYFGRSDNQALADLGIPAHTLSVLYDFPDYHKVGDEWNKLDYPNMAKVDQAVALGVLKLASDPVAPKWNETYPAAARYVEAAKKLKQ